MSWRDMEPGELQWDGRSRGHFEAFDVHLSMPHGERGFWFRFSVDVPLTGEPSASVWAASSSARRREQTLALRHAVSIDQLTTYSGGLDLRIGHQELRAGSSRGGLRTEDPELELRWNVHWRPTGGPVYAYPKPGMYRRPEPVAKVCTPIGSLVADGVVVVNGEDVPIQHAHGAVSHTWGAALPHTWARGTCSSFREDPSASVDALMVTREQGQDPDLYLHFIDEQRHLAFNTGWTVRRARSELSDRGVWTLRTTRGKWRLEGRFSAPLERMAAVRYHGPAGGTRTCHRCDVADAVFHLSRRTASGWKLEQAYTARAGASFEIAKPQPIPGVRVFVQ